MPWWYIRRLLGPGLHWDKTNEQLESAIRQAYKDRMPEAAEHLEIIYDLRKTVMFEEKEPRD